MPLCRRARDPTRVGVVPGAKIFGAPASPLLKNMARCSERERARLKKHGRFWTKRQSANVDEPSLRLPLTPETPVVANASPRVRSQRSRCTHDCILARGEIDAAKTLYRVSIGRARSDKDTE